MAFELTEDELRHALELTNARRRPAGLPPLAAFGVAPAPAQPTPPPPPPPADIPAIPAALAQYSDDLLACSLAVESRRREIRTEADYKRFQPQPSTPEYPKTEQFEAEYPRAPQPPAAQQPPDSDPNQVKMLPEIGIAAVRANAGGAWRLWQLAKTLDRVGSGVVTQAALEDAARSFGVHGRSFARWLSESVGQGWMGKLHRRDGTTALTLASPARVAASLGLQHIGTGWAVIGLRQLLGDKWQGYLWACYLTSFDGPISRERLCVLTGVPERTQRAWENLVSIQYTRNIALSQIPGDHAEGLREVSGRPTFVFTDRKSGTTRTAWRLPDRRTVPIFIAATTGVTGRLSKINVNLSCRVGLYITVGADPATVISADRGPQGANPMGTRASDVQPTGRIFFDEHQAAGKTIRRIYRRRAKKYAAADPRREVYATRRQGRQYKIYDVLPV